MKCLKCESVITKKGESTMVKGLTYCLCQSCGNVMLLQDEKLINTPEDNSPATKLMIEDAVKALGLPTPIVSLDGKRPSLEMQLEETKERFANFVSDLFEEEEENEEEEDVISKMLDGLVKELEENLSMKNMVESINDPKATFVYNLFKDLNMLEEVEKEIKECNSIEELMEAAIKRAELVEERLASLKEDQDEESDDEEDEEMSCDDSFEKLMGTLVKEIFSQDEEFDDEETDETDEYIVIFKDGRYISLKNKTKEEVSEFLNTNEEVNEAEGFRVLRVEDVDIKVSSTIVNTFTLL